MSNASDALDKLRFRALTEPDLYEGDTTLAVRIRADRDAKTLTVEDTGIGMTEAELVAELGTIARSGSRAFLEQLAQRGQKDARLIGQFGVGFYSSYLVADRVEVVSRAAGPGQTAHRWISAGKDTFTVEPDSRSVRGTEIVLHLRADQTEFLEEWRLRDLVKRYSDYVSHPIELLTTRGSGSDSKNEYETINKASALWQRPKSEITPEQYDEFYRHLAHGATEGPAARAHFRVEGVQEFVGLIYIPRERPIELRFGMQPRGIRLYVKRVLVMENCEEVVPEWLRFIVGGVDSDDLPLNVSREVLQESSAVRTIRKQVVRQSIEALEATAQERPADYAAFWKAFGAFVKQGVATDFEHRERLAKLLRYESTAADGLTSLAEYVGRMKEGQPAIYFVVGESRKGLEAAPHLEGLLKRGYEVLLMTDPIDEWAADSLATFEGKPLVSAMRADLKMGPANDDQSPRKAEEAGPLLERFRAVLGSRVSEVRVSDRLIDSPCCLVLASKGPHGFVERLLREAGRDVPKSTRILEINPAHPVIENLGARLAQDDARVGEWIEVLYDQALVAEGAPLEDPSGFARRITTLLASASQPPPPVPSAAVSHGQAPPA